MEQKQTHAVLDFLSPTKAAAIFYPVASMFVILLAKLDSILKSFSTESSIGEMLSKIISKTNDYTTISGSLLWFLVGALIYLLLWAAAVIIIDGYNNILVSTAFMHPQSFHQSEFWIATAGRWLIRLASALLLFAYFLFGIGFLVSFTYTQAVTAWTSSTIPQSLGKFALVTIVGYIGMHFFTLLLRLLLLKRRVY